jgi:hypothetical protein
MVATQYVSRIVNLLALGGGSTLLDDICGLETRKGFKVVRPGDVPWLPRSDWKKSSICSIDDDRVRIVLIEAHYQKTGAFTRLIAALAERRLNPVVVEPHGRLAAKLKSWGWKHRRHGLGDDVENIWYPRP